MNGLAAILIPFHLRRGANIRLLRWTTQQRPKRPPVTSASLEPGLAQGRVPACVSLGTRDAEAALDLREVAKEVPRAAERSNREPPLLRENFPGALQPGDEAHRAESTRNRVPGHGAPIMAQGYGVLQGNPR